MFGVSIFGIVPFATHSGTIVGGAIWVDQCPFITVWTNQIVRASNSQKCGE